MHESAAGAPAADAAGAAPGATAELIARVNANPERAS